MLALAIFEFFLHVSRLYGTWVTNVHAAHWLFIGREPLEIGFATAFIAVIPLIAAFPFANVFFNERNDGTFSMTITRFKSKKRYFVSTGIAVFTASFLIVFIPMLVNAGLLMIAFPMEALRDWTNLSSDATWAFSSKVDNEILLTSFFVNHPYLYNVFTSILFSIFAGGVGVFTYIASVFIRKSRSFMYMFFFVSYYSFGLFALILSEFIGINIILTMYFSPYSASHGSQLGLCIAVVMWLSALVTMMVFAKHKLKKGDGAI